jgi:raffinose/stachyose/melibiose transport system substrate-binding protein
MFKKSLFILTIVMLILAACAKPTTSAPATSAPAQATAAPAEKVTITMWEGSNGDYDQKLQDDFVKTFNDAHPNVNLVLTFQQDIERQVSTALQAGSAPDVFTTPGPFLMFGYQAGNQILALDDYAKQYGWNDKILKWALDASMIKGSLYSVPVQMETLVLFYNKTLLNKLGMQPPTNLQELEAVCDAATKAGKWCFSAAAPVDGFWAPEVWDNYIGSDIIYKAMSNQIKWTDPAIVSAVQLSKDWMDKGYFSGSYNKVSAMTYDNLLPPVANGDAVFMPNGAWAFSSVAEASKTSGQEWDWMAWPSLNPAINSVYDLSIGDSVAINAATKHPAEAAMVVDWLYNDRARAAKIIEDMDFSQWVVPLKFQSTDFSSATDPRLTRYLQDFTSVTGAGRFGYTFWTFLPSDINNDWVEAQLDNVWGGKMTPEDFLVGLQAAYDKDYAAGLVNPVPEPSGIKK